MKTCYLAHCSARSRSLGLCANHYRRKLRGSPGWDQPSQYEKTLDERFWEKVNKSGGLPDFTDPLMLLGPDCGECWAWIAVLSMHGKDFDNGGYGRIVAHGKTRRAHRVAYFMDSGAYPPDDLTVDHLCRNRACVRLSHLELVPAGTNSLRGGGILAVHARKTHCPGGHELVPENIYPNATGRICAICNREGNKRRGAAKRTHCSAGHEYTPANIWRGTDGRKLCVACKQARTLKLAA